MPQQAPGASNGKTGAGLGLAIVREVAERYGGRAYVAGSGATRGTEVVIELPAPPRVDVRTEG